MTNLENAKNALDGVSYQIDVEIGSKIIKETVVPISQAFYALKLASEPDWKFIDKNEFPEINELVICHFKSALHSMMVYKEFDKEYWIDKIIAWLSIPIFNKP